MEFGVYPSNTAYVCCEEGTIDKATWTVAIPSCCGDTGSSTNTVTPHQI